MQRKLKKKVVVCIPGTLLELSLDDVVQLLLTEESLSRSSCGCSKRKKNASVTRLMSTSSLKRVNNRSSLRLIILLISDMINFANMNGANRKSSTMITYH